MDNATFASTLCGLLETSAATPGSLYYLSISGADLLLELPDCVWAEYGLYSSSLLTVTLNNLLVRGNSSGNSSEVGPSSSNPLMRISTSITSLTIQSCILVDPTTTTYAPSWQAFVELMTQLTSLQVYDSPIGGSVITSVPLKLVNLQISNSGLTGSISSSLLSLVSGRFVTIVLSFNELTGTIPADLFANFADVSTCSSGSFDFNSNKLTGSIPDSLLSSGTSCSFSFDLYLGNNSLTGTLPSSMCSGCSGRVNLDLTQNQLSGTISPSIFDVWFATHPSVLTFLVSNNSFTGAVPGIFANLPAPAFLSRTYLDFSYNKLTSVGLNVIANTSINNQEQYLYLGFNQISSLPDHFLDTRSPSLVIDLTGNKLTALPAGLLHGNAYPTPDSVSVLLGQNLLTSFPEDLFNSSLKYQGFTFNVSHTPTLTGSLPSSLTSIIASDIIYYNLDFSHCGFTGAIPNMPFTNQTGSARLYFASNRLNNGSSGLHLSSFIAPTNNVGLHGITLDISDNAFVGVLNIASGLSASQASTLTDDGLHLNASGNSFTALAFDDNWASATYSLDISRNTLMTTANFPESLFNGSSVIETLYASKTGIVGVFPILTNEDFLQLYELDFSGSSGIDFCSGNRTAWATDNLSVCKLYLTTAANCTSLYPIICEFTAPPEAPSSTPSSIPAAPGTPSSTPAAPGTPSSTPVAPETPSATPTRPPTGAASTTSASILAIAFAALIALAASI